MPYIKRIVNATTVLLISFVAYRFYYPTQMASKVLFTPLKLGAVTLSHRVVLAPLTRYRADENHVHHEIAAEYYGQRASKGGLLITEATFISKEAGGYRNVPGIWNEAQITGWKHVTDAVHAKGGYIYVQLWSLGRAADLEVVKEEGIKFVSASPTTFRDDGVLPEPLTKEEIQQYVEAHAQAARNAIKAGFDGVEIHNANGYLLDQFLQDKSNQRTDEYGGSIENRARFPLEVAEAVTKAIGQERVGIRLAPFNVFQGMGMDDPIPTFSYITKEFRDRFPNLSYLHIFKSKQPGAIENSYEDIKFINDIWNEKGERTLLVAGGLQPDTAEEGVKKYGGAAVFGKWFISNPDLTLRIKHKIPLNPYDFKTFYARGIQARQGYVDYPFADKEDPEL